MRRVVTVSRVDRLKRVDLLLDALDRHRQDLSGLSFRILGLGPEFEALKERAQKAHPNVEFAGFCPDVAGEMAGADLLLHTCAVETFGLVVLEAMAARLAALVPDQGGTGLLIQDGVSGFTFKADDADALAARLVELKDAPAEQLNRIVENASLKVQHEYSSDAALRRYREIFRPG